MSEHPNIDAVWRGLARNFNGWVGVDHRAMNGIRELLAEHDARNTPVGKAEAALVAAIRERNEAGVPWEYSELRQHLFDLASALAAEGGAE